jgi:type VI secretion system secreted protein VgrG
MAYLTKDQFTFASQALPEKTFGVLDFEGTEGLSQCYRFNIRLVSDQGDLDLAEVLQNPAVFTMHREEGDIPFHGIPVEFEQLHSFDNYYFYRVELAPRFWWLTLTHHNQVFLNKAVPDILKEVLADGGLTSLDFELRLTGDYPEWEYVCQYRESHFNFVSRWMEREGIYYYFEQTASGEKLILTDTSLAHTAMPEGRTATYAPPSGTEALHTRETVQALVFRQRNLPQRLEMKDYNYRTPSLEMTAGAEVLPQGRGLVYLYGEHFRTPEEGQALAKIRAEEMLCREKYIMGEGTVPFLRPGYVFDLTDHYQERINQSYLTVEIRHSGSQTAYLTSGLRQAVSRREEQPFYRNSFTAIPAGVQFRPERITEKARFYGTMNAVIDAAGSGKYAELDEEGRYKVILPFDLSGRQDGKASTYLRLVQPYGGSEGGLHFPLHKGVEVLLNFIDGDPDRPLIVGSVPNPDHPSPVTSANQTQCQITSGGQNRIHMEDREGQQRVLMQTPATGAWMRLGSTNDPPPPKASSGYGINIYTSDALVIDAGFQNSVILGESTTTIVGGQALYVGGIENKSVFGIRTDFTAGTKFTYRQGGEYKYGSNRVLALPSRVKTVGAQFEDYVNRNTVGVARNELTAAANQAVGNQTQAIADRVNVVAMEETARGGFTDLMGERMVAITARMEGIATKAEAIGSAMKTIGVGVTEAGTLMRTAGSETDVAGTGIDDAGMSLLNAGNRTRAAMLVVDG